MNSKLSIQNQNYNLNDVINNLYTDKQQKLVFIGRTPDQPNVKIEGWSSYTLDINLSATESTIMSTENPSLAKHIQMDFNDEEFMGKIQHQFDKVIVDGCVVKGMHHIWTTLHRLLTQKKDAEIIVERYMILQSNWSKQTSEYKIESQCINLNAKDFIEHAKYCKTNGYDAGWDFQKMIFIDKTETYLKDLFDEVILVRNEPHPYDNLIFWKNPDFWRLRSPKEINYKNQT